MYASSLPDPFCEPLVQIVMIYLAAVLVVICADRNVSSVKQEPSQTKSGTGPDCGVIAQIEQDRLRTEEEGQFQEGSTTGEQRSSRIRHNPFCFVED